jgi:hypothetical protein
MSSDDTRSRRRRWLPSTMVLVIIGLAISMLVQAEHGDSSGVLLIWYVHRLLERAELIFRMSTLLS